MLQDVLSKNCKAFATWADRGTSCSKLSGERTACLPSALPGKSDLSVSQLTLSTN